jgi:hypothetical protein
MSGRMGTETYECAAPLLRVLENQMKSPVNITYDLFGGIIYLQFDYYNIASHFVHF